MRLKRLELYGYKSFATRHTFEFTEGITAIVGPNGSGKSNVADAVRWVMGEQSYRNLRAKSTEDMIFGGSRNRSRLGMAEVILTLDNTEGWLPIDYTEVTIGRRAYRSGENEYLLNGHRVRYRDLLDILGSAGLMRGSYTVIGQGMVDAALALRPEARRGLFEEAAGIAPHLRKREEALQRIAETERNLERVQDILNELRPRASALRRQAERAEEYSLLRQDLQALQRLWYGYQWQRHQHHVARAEELLKEQAARLEAQRSRFRELQDQQNQLSAHEERQRTLLEELTAEEARLRRDAERLQHDLAIASERTRLYHEQRDALALELQTLSLQRATLLTEIDRAQAELEAQEKAQTAAQREASAAQRELAHVDASRRKVEQQIAAQQSRLTQLSDTLADHRARLEQLAERRTALLRSRHELEQNLVALDDRAQCLEEQSREITQRERAAHEAQQTLRQRLATLEAEIALERQRIATTEKRVAALRAEYAQRTARYELLGRLRAELTGYHPGVREVLSATSVLRGLLGTVATLMDVPQDLEQAIDAALGSRLQYVIAERWENAEAAIEHLKRTQAGWVTFLPLDTLQSRPPITPPRDPGVVGVASRLVRFEERTRPAFEYLLGSVLIVQDLATARHLLQYRTGASLLVTLGGETVQPSGALSGGARRQAANLLAQEREWRSLPAMIAESEERLANAQRELENQMDILADLQRQSQEQEQRAARLREARESIQAAVVAHAQEVQGAERERQWLASRLEQTTGELDEAAAREQHLRADWELVRKQQEDARQTLEGLRQSWQALGNDELRQRVAELEMHAAIGQRAVHSQRTLLASHRHSLKQLNTQIEGKEGQVAHLTSELEALAANIATKQAQLAQIEEQLATLAARTEPARQELATLQKAQRDLAHQRAYAMERLNEAEMEFNRLTLERDRAKAEQAALARDIEAELGPIDLPGHASQQLRLELGDDVTELPTVNALPPGLGDEIRDLKARLRRLGNVNPDAPQEYEQLLERQTFLQTQASDLRGCIASLHEVIQELDAMIERDFRATVKKVDHAFGVYFNRLFQGGDARLLITDPENVNASGIDIIAHPPGKRAQNLSLLSGGERALTAVALLFALLKVNPVPFCFLDEVDAALDEVNVKRFRELLQEHARTTQFIVITHNRHTIEAAGTIYGISMGEQGISQCISLQLESAMDRRWTPEIDAEAIPRGS